MAVSTIKAEFQCEIEKVWELVTSLDNYSWRSDLDKIVVTVPEKEFEEHTKDGYVTKFKTTAFDECKKYEFDMENGNMQGHWMGKFSYKEGVTFIEFTEDVTAKKLVMKPFVGMYLKKQQAKYIQDLREALEAKKMTCDEIIEELKANASEKYKANVVKMGIPEEYSMGVSTAVVRAIAKKAGKSNELARELWNSGYHEAKLLAVLVFDKKTISYDEIEKLICDVQLWDLCDHLCKNLIIKLKNYDEFISNCITSTHTYNKRAAFTLIASSVVHNKAITNDALDDYLRIIQEYSDSEY